MITRERLNELVKQGATIYVECWGKTKKLDLNDLEYMEVEDDDIYYELTDNTARTTDLEHLFETQEEAEWYKEFGNIVRSEVLDLPTWEEFRVIGAFAFCDYKNNLINVMTCLDPVNVAPCNDCIYIADKKKSVFL